MATTSHGSSRDALPFLEDLLSGWGGHAGDAGLLGTPSADVTENEQRIRVALELPGMRPEDIEVDLENNVLTISGEKREEQRGEDEQRHWHLSERRFGRFSRSFVLPRDVDPDRIEARYENGVLVVTIPRSAQGQPRRIQVQAGGQPR